MEVLPAHVDTRSESHRADRSGLLERIDSPSEQLALARAGGVVEEVRVEVGRLPDHEPALIAMEGEA